jgi:hypothetical protein
MANEYLKIELDPTIKKEYMNEILEIVKDSECDFVDGKLLP